jgi:integrase
MPLSVLRELVGHSSFTATQRYYRINPDRQSREYYAAMEFIDLKQ